MSQRRAFGRSFCSAVALGLSALAVVPGAFADPAKKPAVADLRYGVSLYHYYQQDYLAALSELMVADARGQGIQGHGNHPELIAGGISLAFGMEEHAEQLFSRLLQDHSRPLTVRDAAWFYLGKLHYTRANWTQAEQSFARVSPTFSPRLAAEMAALRINLQIRQAQLTPIPLAQLERKQLRDWSPFALYNLGAAYARIGNYEQAREYYRAAVATPAPKVRQARQEHRALLDKTFTALGYTYLLEKRYGPALEAFTQVRLNSSFSQQALLGYGWAALEQKKYQEAVRPWQVLQQRSLLHPEVQEALLALPYAYEQLGAAGDALAAYQEAETLLTAEIARVQDMRATLTEGELLHLVGSEPQTEALLQEAPADPGTLVAVVTDDGANWLKLDTTSIIKTRSGYLRELFAQTAFQRAVLDLRDLLRLQRLLQEWQPRLDIYTELLQEKRAQREQTEQRLAQQALQTERDRLLAEQARLSAELDHIRTSEDYLAFATADRRALFERVERSQATLARQQQAGEDIIAAQAQLDLYRGILLWEAAQAFPDRLWQAEKVRRLSAATSAEIAARYQRINTLSQAHSDIQPQLAHLARLQADTAEYLARTDALIAAHSAALRNQVDQQLQQQQQRLTAYLAQAHLAVARLYDSALRADTP
jgi:hypothetical protein